MPYFVCHKCGLPRRMTEPDKVYLGSCDCLGQTTFGYEETPRTRDEAVVIAVGEFLKVLALYLEQHRAGSEFFGLVKKYKEALLFKDVYKVVVNV